MSEENGFGADVEANIAGQQIRVRNVKSLNTLATVATLIICICGFAIGYQMFDAHAKDTKETTNAVVAALKDLTKVHRENGKEQVKEQRTLRCVMGSEQKDRRRAEDDCERNFR